MTINNIKTTMARGEGPMVEFKKTTGQLERGMETLCAFLMGMVARFFSACMMMGALLGRRLRLDVIVMNAKR